MADEITLERGIDELLGIEQPAVAEDEPEDLEGDEDAGSDDEADDQDED